MQPAELTELKETRLWREQGLTFKPARDNYLLSNFLLRSPAFVPNPSRHADQTDLTTALPVVPAAGTHGGILTSSRVLGVRDLLLLGHISRAYHRLGCPDDGFVPISLGEGADAMGYSSTGGRQRAQVVAAQDRLMRTLLAWWEWWEDGLLTRTRFRLFQEDRAAVDTRRGVVVPLGVRLTTAAVEIAEHTRLTSLHHETAKALVAADEVAARLWLLLESERIPADGFDYHLFRAAPGEEPADANGQVYIAELLGMDHWQERKRVAQDVRGIIRTLHEIDGQRWTLRLDRRPDRGMGMYLLHVERKRRPRPEVRTGTEAGEVGTDGYQGRYGRVPQEVRTGTEVGTDGYLGGENSLQNGHVSDPPALKPTLYGPLCITHSTARCADGEGESPSEEGAQEPSAPAPSPSGDSTALAIRGDEETPFEAFWEPYPRREAEKEARRLWKPLTADQRRLAAGVAQVMGRMVAEGRKERRYVPAPVTFLRDERWEDWRDGVPAGWQTAADLNDAIIAAAIAGDADFSTGDSRLDGVLAACAAAYGVNDEETSDA